MKKGYKNNIEKLTLENDNFRQVLYTAKHSQLVLMSLKPSEEIGEEVQCKGDDHEYGDVVRPFLDASLLYHGDYHGGEHRGDDERYYGEYLEIARIYPALPEADGDACS